MLSRGQIRSGTALMGIEQFRVEVEAAFFADLIYFADTQVGSEIVAAGVVGTLIAVSKLFDGFTDIFFGSMIDKTQKKGFWESNPWCIIYKFELLKED